MRRFAFLALALLVTPDAALAKKPPRGFEASVPQDAVAQRPADGSIFNASAGYTALIQGSRAHGVGDVVMIILSETTTTAKSATTKTSRAGSASITPPTAGPVVLDPNALNAASQSSFNGAGNTAQTSSFGGTIAVTIAQVRPNGTVLVRGEKRMLLSQGQEWIQFSGIVRLADIDNDNTVASAKVADARIEYAGNGTIQRAGREGWLSRFFNTISPF